MPLLAYCHAVGVVTRFMDVALQLLAEPQTMLQASPTLPSTHPVGAVLVVVLELVDMEDVVVVVVVAVVRVVVVVVFVVVVVRVVVVDIEVL